MEINCVLPLIGTVILWGIGQVFAKEGNSIVGPGNMLLLYALNTLIIWGGYFFLSQSITLTTSWELWLLLTMSSTLSASGWLFYYLALRRGKVSLIAPITSAYSLITIVFAWIFLDEILSYWQYQGLILVIISIMTLSYNSRPPENPAGVEEIKDQSKEWLYWSFLSCLSWGISVVISKRLVSELGYINLLGHYAFLTPPALLCLWWWQRHNVIHGSWRAWIISELSQLSFCLGGIFFVMSMAREAVSLVAPLANLYPLVTLLFARLYLAEKINGIQGVAIMLIIASLVLLAF
jgi:bacterial/archaeal transporter family protein